MEGGCSTPDEQPVSQYCDAFKTLGVQSADKLSFNSDYQGLCPKDTASLALLASLASHSSRLSDHLRSESASGSPAQISVLRI
jgi:hypothetical protein